ncbi:DUF6766 family protein [Runella slithyformis]|uniref:Transmembrane protein n=1 Tax=Runella slithyformis (strain ATCC 29530 / DSM 19594 / LMG 11500 / NCIMB 11436 / LSU 4) TaxID=761193 RepID=A0A7U4E669_RUNSL|nr:DUF6766 family protein [Runella slithyformis]AEI48943.1 hypothetical protein Runsl_2539 [Runella slithyformis DSM 19594]
MNAKPSFWVRNGLSLALLTCFLLFWLAQALTGHHEYNREQLEKGLSSLSLGKYLHTGHFLSTTFENWESEFFQMLVYVLFTISLRQQGSAESKSLGGEEAEDKPPQVHPKAPWAVKKGGIWLKLYANSLSFALFLLFIFSFGLHAYGSYEDYRERQNYTHDIVEPFGRYMSGSRFWFESFQNWQSEFLAVLTIVFLSIYLRQKGSPESKAVDAPHRQTGKE